MHKSGYLTFFRSIDS